MTIDLVTGGAGFIGCHLVRRLVADGHRVRVIDDLSTGDPARLADVRSAIEFAERDLATDDLTDAFRGVGNVFHLAAIPSVPRSVRDPLRTHHAVATGTLRLLLAARDASVRRVVLSSSSSVYGESEVTPKTESTPPRPVSPYGAAKASAEAYARIFASLYGVRTVALRYFNVFGPFQDPSSGYAAVIPRFVSRALGREVLEVHGDGEQTRDFTYVDNVVEANVAAAAADVPAGRVYNVAGGEPRSVNQLVQELERILGRTLPRTHTDARPADIRHSHADISAARRELGWVPHVSFADGLRRTVQWYANSR